MDFNIIKEFEKILSETNWKSEAEEQVRLHRSSGAHEADNPSKKSKKRHEEEDSGEEKSKESGRADIDLNDEVEEEKPAPGELKIENALKYSAQKSALNKLRASHSFEDPEVDKEMKKYFERLTKDEKKVLYVLVKGLTQVSLLDISGKTAYIPSDMNIHVSSKGPTSNEKIKSKERAQSLSKDEDENVMQDITNTPIVIGGDKRNDESLREIYNIVKSNA